MLLSGGTTSLIGAPVRRHLAGGADRALRPAARLRARHHRHEPDPEALLPLGRRHASPCALAPARVRVLHRVRRHRRRPRLDRLRPLRPRPLVTRVDVRGLLEAARLWDRIPESARALVSSAERGRNAETPKPGDQAFARVTLELIASNRLALEAAARRAAELGLAPSGVGTRRSPGRRRRPERV